MTLPYRLIILGLIVVPFYEIILYLMLPGTQMPAVDGRLTKEYSALCFALAIGLLTAGGVGLKRFPNKWFLAFLFLAFFGIYKAPFVYIPLYGQSVGGFWNYEPLFALMVFTLMAWGIASLPMNWIDREKIIGVVMWCTGAMAAYVLLQAAGLDQIFAVVDMSPSKLTQNPHLVGSLGNPTFAAAFIACGIPIALFRFQYLLAFIMASAVFFIESDFGLLGAGVGVVYYVVSSLQGMWFRGVMLAVAVAGALTVGHMHQKGKIQDSGRFQVWKWAIEDVQKSPVDSDKLKYAITGYGIGAMPYLFPLSHETKFRHAHNEYIQVLYGCGVAGLFALLAAIASFFRCLSATGTRQGRALTASFTALAACAAGTYVWQLGAHQFYTAVIVGLSYNGMIHHNKESRTCIS